MFSRENTEEEIAEAIRRFSFIQLAVMAQTNQYGEAGRERILHDYCRNLFGIKPDAETNPLETREWPVKLQEKIAPHLNIPLPDLQKRLAEAGVSLDGKWYSFNPCDELNSHLKSIGSDFQLFYGQREHDHPVILLGPTSWESIGDYEMATVNTETVRTPTAILPVVAFIQKKKHIVVRREALDTIFTQKWRWTWSHGSTAFDKGTEFSNILKQLTLLGYQAHKDDEIDRKRTLIVDEMSETTKIHEICHGVIAGSLDDDDFFQLTKLLRRYPSGNIIEVLDETIAEWMPEQAGHEGPVSYLCKLALTGSVPRATRILYRYLSDSWFLGNRDQSFMFPLTDFFVSSVLRFAKPEGSFDYKAMYEAVPETYHFFLSRMQEAITEVKSVLENATYNAQGFDYSFAQIAQSQRQYLSQELSKRNRMEFFSRHFWDNILRFAKQYSPATFDAVARSLSTAEQRISREWLEKIGAEKWGSDLRGYLYSQAEEKLTPALARAIKATQKSTSRKK